MKTTLEILKVVKKRWENQPRSSRGESQYAGLCECEENCRFAVELTLSEEELFEKYFRRSKRGQKWFYVYNGFKTLDRDQFAWPRFQYQSRLDWLNHNIEKLEQEKLEQEQLNQ